MTENLTFLLVGHEEAGIQNLINTFMANQINVLKKIKLYSIIPLLKSKSKIKI